jgi:hypothetical protein
LIASSPDHPVVPTHDGGPDVINRRHFLAGASAVVAAPVLVWLGIDLATDDPAGPRSPDRRPHDNGPVPTLPPQYLQGAPTVALLARTGPYLTSPGGTFSTSYQEDSPVEDKTWDMRGARFLGYFDKDAFYETGEFAGGSTPEQKNIHPIRLGRAMPMGGAAIIGGVVEGTQPETLTWERMKYGQEVQDDTDRWIDAGRPRSVDPHAAQRGNDNQDGDPRMYIREGTWAVWDGVRVRNSHDGIGLYRAEEEGSGTCYVRNCWLQDIRDDAIENDQWHDLHVLDTLVDGTYTFLSTQRNDDDDSDSEQVITVEDSVIRLKPFPGGYLARSTDHTHGSIYKSRPNSPGLVLRNVVIAAERFRDLAGSDGLDRILPTRQGSIVDSYENVTLVWLGEGPYPGNVPDGCTLTTDPAVYEAAVADWKTRHGVDERGGVDMGRMLTPALPAWRTAPPAGATPPG